MRQPFRLPLAVLVLLLALLTSACGGAASPTAAPPQPTAKPAAGTPADQVKAVKAAKAYKMGVSLPTFDAPFLVAMAYGIADEAKQPGDVSVTFTETGGYGGLDKQLKTLEDWGTAKLDAAMLVPLSFEGSAKGIDDLASKGIPVVEVSPSKSDKPVTTVLQDDYAIGKRMGERVVEKLGAKGGKVIMFTGPAGVRWTEDRSKGFKDAVKANSAIQIAAEKATDTDPSAALTVAESTLQAIPDANYIYTVTDVIRIGVTQAMAGAKLLGKIPVSTTTLTPDNRKMIEDGTLDMVVSEAPALAGRMLVRAAVTAANGQKPPRQVILPLPAYTKENIASADTSIDIAPASFSVPK